ncbi:MAG: Ig-like domain-containing protein, partial [Planctomycetota bacterium]
DLSAPGALTTVRPEEDSNGDGLAFVAGTSISAPYVAAAAGLALSVNPELTPTPVMDILRNTADDLGPPGFDELTGWGRVNFHSAVLVAANTPPGSDTTPPSVVVVAPAEGDVVSGMITIIVEAADNVGVSQVDLLVNGMFVSSDTVPPHEWAFDTTNLADGPGTISAVAHDAAGNSAESATVQVTVDNSTPPVECLNAADCDDGLFCNGAESCDADGNCQPGGDPCPGQDCDEPSGACVAIPCDNDGTCEEGEDCNNCPGDCLSGSGPSCGNGVCEVADGEDCLSCPQDCSGRQGGKPSRRYCCGDGAGHNPVGCADARCSQGGSSCNADPAAGSCCGDGACTGYEDGFTCELDCGLPPFCGDGVCDADEDPCACSADCGQPSASEIHCANGTDEDCDGDTDCDDEECAGDAACACLPRGAPCTGDADCCSNKCRGNNTCGR